MFVTDVQSIVLLLRSKRHEPLFSLMRCREIVQLSGEDLISVHMVPIEFAPTQWYYLSKVKSAIRVNKRISMKNVSQWKKQKNRNIHYSADFGTFISSHCRTSDKHISMRTQPELKVALGLWNHRKKHKKEVIHI